jgi:hypothetical protein
MGVCCGCDSKQDILTEIKKASVAEGSVSAKNNKLITTDVTNAEQIILKHKENPLKEYSLLLFQELNKFRTEPHEYYAESIKYNFDDIVNELIYIKNKKIKRDLKLQWSTKKEIIINNIMNDENIKDIKTKLNIIKQKFESNFDIIILFVQGSYDSIRNSLWEVLNNFKKLDNKIFKNIILNKIDYCVIYSIKSDNIIFKKLYKEDNIDIDIDIDIDVDLIIDKNEGQDNNNNNIMNDKTGDNKIISFYFLFNYLDDEDKNYNMINNNVVCW